jgi:hypothetical protein
LLAAMVVHPYAVEGSGEKRDIPPLELTCTMDKSVYRPGEAVVIDVRLHNNTRQRMTVRQLDASSIIVAYNRLGDPETPVLREPVYAKNEPLNAITPLAVGQTVERKFVFTRLSHFQGPLKAQAQYDPNPPRSFINGSSIYGNVMNFEVAGPPLFERDNAGLITQAAAIALAKKQVQSAVTDAKAILVEDKNTGLYVTWINLSVASAADGKPTIESFLVDPYRGFVRGRSRPFRPEAAEDPHFKRPVNLPPRPEQTGRATESGAVPPKAPTVPTQAPPAAPAPASPAGK